MYIVEVRSEKYDASNEQVRQLAMTVGDIKCLSSFIKSEDRLHDEHKETFSNKITDKTQKHSQQQN
ncbi:CLUMA_CG016630, isoform A [Clunio marinus]|uniref:CLUMA_CG016630, isoform A n=1 Tax=Clunio marinus TaxID=568069 RepID=A0A1J1IRX3_9DIPT|nr:CLUMA_CG016630, isoform A [Clunio marinus]